MPEFDSATLTIWMNPEGDTQANCNTLNKTGKRWISSIRPLKSNISVFASDIVNKTTFDSEWNNNFWLGVENPLAPASDNDKTDIFLEQLSSTIEAGNNLYDYLFEQGLDEILTKIDAMPDGTYLKIITNFAFFSWEILSPRVPGDIDPKNAYKKMWGYRFITNYELIPDSDDGFSPPLENHNNGKSNIVLNVNPQINEELKQSVLLPNKPHFDFYENLIANGNLGRLLTSGGEIKESLLSSTNDATIIYIYCHGRNTDPFKPGCDETLELDKNITIKPDFLRRRDSDFSRGPIIFLNSCKSGAISPLSFVSFLKIFQQKKAMGILGTTIKIPAIFAAAFGIKILESYLDGNYVSLALYNLRRDLLDHYNPLGLFYSLQCPDDVSAPRQNSESHNTQQ